MSEENGALRFKRNEKERFGPDVDVASIRDEEDDTIATMSAALGCLFYERRFTRAGKHVGRDAARVDAAI